MGLLFDLDFNKCKDDAVIKLCFEFFNVYQMKYRKILYLSITKDGNGEILENLQAEETEVQP